MAALPKYQDIQEVDQYLNHISDLEDQLKSLQKSYQNLQEQNQINQSKLLHSYIQDIQHQLDRDLQVKQLNKLRLQEEGIKSELYGQAVSEVESAFSKGLYDEFVKELFKNISKISKVQAGPKLSKLVPKKHSPVKVEEGVLVIISENKEYDLSPESLKKELAKLITINKLNKISQKTDPE